MVRILFNLFFVFLKIGCIAFGGGYAILPILERELVEKRKWLRQDEVINFFTIAQVTPGIISVNISTFIGYKKAGIAGGIIATLGFVIPSSTMIIIAAAFLQNFAHIPAVRHCFAGIRIAVGALVLDSVIKLLKNIVNKKNGYVKNITGAVIFTAGFVLALIFKVNPVFIVFGALLLGFVFCCMIKT